MKTCKLYVYTFFQLYVNVPIQTKSSSVVWIHTLHKYVLSAQLAGLRIVNSAPFVMQIQ